MRKVSIIYDIFKFEELSEDVKNKLINEEIDLIVDEERLRLLDPLHRVCRHDLNLQRALREINEMRTPWFFAEYVYKYCKNDILTLLNSHEYYEDGEIFAGDSSAT